MEESSAKLPDTEPLAPTAFIYQLLILSGIFTGVFSILITSGINVSPAENI